MRLLLSVEHPAWAHQFRYMIEELKRKGHEIKVVAIRKDVTCELLDAFNILYEIISETSVKGIIEKGIIFLKTTYAIFQASRQFKPDMYFGRSSPMMAINSFFFRKPHILFEDTEIASFSLMICKVFSNVIITPTCFTKDLGHKQLRIEAYKELFYLYPNYYRPNFGSLDGSGVDYDEKYIIIRFLAWDAHHDIGKSGLTLETKRKAIREFEKYGRVFITSEKPLPDEFEKYRITVSPEKMHDLLCYATLLYGESSTMASECAVLGTHAIFCDFAGRGYTDEEESRYDLVYNFRLDSSSQEASIEKAVELLQEKDLKEKGREKRERLLNEKIDVTSFMVWFMENYPGNVGSMNDKPPFGFT
ncbi:putative glycosyltransferase [Methanocalculus alkaliphilus]|nr:putative glycosyltransferase [Methanocalculus alkaliphilus]